MFKLYFVKRIRTCKKRVKIQVNTKGFSSTSYGFLYCYRRYGIPSHVVEYKTFRTVVRGSLWRLFWQALLWRTNNAWWEFSVTLRSFFSPLFPRTRSAAVRSMKQKFQFPMCPSSPLLLSLHMADVGPNRRRKACLVIKSLIVCDFLISISHSFWHKKKILFFASVHRHGANVNLSGKAWFRFTDIAIEIRIFYIQPNVHVRSD